MTRLVTVSNRVAMPKPSRAPGGLEVGVLAALREHGGLWFGWDGNTEAAEASPPQLQQRDGITFATVSLPRELYELAYSGFSNGTLWPLFHYLLDGFRYQDREFEAYLAVNDLFAKELHPLLREDDLVWVHDYQLIPLGERLRERGCQARLGFFLHVPFPHFEVLRALPVFPQLMLDLLRYDLIGFQTETDRAAFLGAIEAMWGSAYLGRRGSIVIDGRNVRTGVFPIGVDVDAVGEASLAAYESAAVERMRAGLLDRRLIIGVDRLDYSKGLLERFEAYRRFLEHCPQHLGQVTYLQIAPLGRQNVKAYARIRDSLEQSAGRTNGRFADADWTPIRYLNRNFPHATLMGFMRSARVCLVTPVRDGMNLVAKEFIAAQARDDPGVLVLSDRAGAACELNAALLVNPYDIGAMARAMEQALDMPLAERRARHESLLATLRSHDVHRWRSRFLEALARCETGPLLARKLA